MKQRASYAIRPIRGGIAELIVADRAKQIPDSIGAVRAWHELSLPGAPAAHAARAAQFAAKP